MSKILLMYELLRDGAEYAHKEFIQTLEGVTEAQAWAILPNLGPDYLHSAGCIYSIAMHVAGCKRAYGSICFRNTEMRWRDLAERFDEFEPNWEKAMTFLHDAHEYWMDSWANFSEEQLREIRPTNWANPMEAWKIIRVVSYHDSYHAGQIAMLRYGVTESNTPPPKEAEDIRTHCASSVHW